MVGLVVMIYGWNKSPSSLPQLDEERDSEQSNLTPAERKNTAQLPLSSQAGEGAEDLLLARVLAVVWPIIVFVSLISWTRQTWASQGRLWFSAIAPLSIWMAVGLASWLPARFRNWRAIPVGAAALWFAGVAIMAPTATIHPAYTLDRGAVLAENSVEQGRLRTVCFAEPDKETDALCIAYHLVGGTVFPGDYANFTPIFASKGEMAHNWSIFVHFVNEDGLIEAQRDVYPGGGLLATSEIKPGETWNNPIAVQIPEGIYAPQTLDVYLGLYWLQPNGNSSQRMIPSGEGADTEQARLPGAGPPGTAARRRAESGGCQFWRGTVPVGI